MKIEYSYTLGNEWSTLNINKSLLKRMLNEELKDRSFLYRSDDYVDSVIDFIGNHTFEEHITEYTGDGLIQYIINEWIDCEGI